MEEVILNDKCMHCNDRECHDGYNFCNQAMKENSFYKNAKLYKGLEVIHRPTYEELEKEAEEIYTKTDKEFMDCQDEGEIFNLGYLAGAEPREKRIVELETQIENIYANHCGNCNRNILNSELRKENAELKTENQKWQNEWQEQVQKKWQ